MPYLRGGCDGYQDVDLVQVKGWTADLEALHRADQAAVRADRAHRLLTRLVWRRAHQATARYIYYQ